MNDAREPRTKQRRGPLIGVLVAVAIIGGVTYGLGVEGSLPYVSHPDEPSTVHVTTTLVNEGEPRWFQYPSFLFDIQAAPHWAARLLGAASSDSPFASSSEAIGVTRTSRPNSWILGRTITAVFAVLGALAAAAIGWRVTRRWWAALLAGIAATFAPLAANSAWLITPDVYAATFATLAVLASLWILERGGGWPYAAAGFAAGLAAGAKYNAVLVVVAIVVAHLLRDRFKNLRLVAIAAVATVAGFIATTPYLLVDFDRFWADLTLVAEHYSSGHLGAQGNAFGFHLQRLWETELLLLVLAVAAPFVAPRWRRELTVMGAWVLTYFVVISSVTVRFERNLLPLLPTLLAAAAIGACALVDRWPLVASALVVVLLIGPVIQVIDLVGDRRTDEAQPLRSWVDDNVPEGSAIALEGYSPWTDNDRWDVVAMWSAAERRPSWYGDHVDYVFVSPKEYCRFFDGEHGRRARRYERMVAEYPTVTAAKGVRLLATSEHAVARAGRPRGRDVDLGRECEEIGL